MTQQLPQEAPQLNPAVLQFIRDFARNYKPVRPTC